ncbi:MAG: cupin domain-containing protein [Chitinophagaceae bacterium]|nr:cupin domain-containing protein [Chitinophagaceae bacterium]
MNRTIVNPIIKDEITFTQTASGTNGRTTCLLVKLMPGGGTPMHYHKNFEECFIVLDGELTLELKDSKIILLPGQEYTVSKREPHRFANESDREVNFTTIIRPASQGFEDALCILYGLARDQRTNDKGIPVNMLELSAVSSMSDMHQVGLPFFVKPLIALFATVAKITGVNKKLRAKYCNYSGL